jgi:ATP-dependent Lhr-like helicase
MLRRPPHILVTTPESLYLLLTSAKSLEILRTVNTVIVDEIHALARDKRGSHLALSLERLESVCSKPPVRIGLSATQRPMNEIACFLVGARRVSVGGAAQAGSANRLININGSHSSSVDRRLEPNGHAAPPLPNGSGSEVRTASPALRSQLSALSPSSFPSLNSQPSTLNPQCSIVDVGHVRALDLAIEVPPSELTAVCSRETWDEIYARLAELIRSHRSTLIFVNTRRLAERVSYNLRTALGDDSVASHHGSLSRDARLAAEQRLQAGELKAIVATASLELGIDVGHIDLVCQIGSPRSIATFLQRVGRSGHSLGALPKGRLLPLSRDELLECLALIRAVRQGRLDRIEMPDCPLDILAQQIVAAVAVEDWAEDDLFELCRGAWPFRNLSRADFDAIIQMLSDGPAPALKRGAYLHHDRINRRVRAKRGARLAALTSGGAIPEVADYRVYTEGDRTFVGTVNEDFAVESMTGDVFLLGNTSWRVRHVRGGEIVVNDAQGAPANVPFWLGEAPSRTVELSAEISDLRQQLANKAGSKEQGSGVRGQGSEAKPESASREEAMNSALPSDNGHGDQTPEYVAEPGHHRKNGHAASLSLAPDLCSLTPAQWLIEECGASPWAAEQATNYVVAQLAATGLVPTQKRIVFERFFDESGGMQLVIHSPLGARINRAWGLALRKRFCRSFDFELQASADDNGIVLSLGLQHSFPIEHLFRMLTPENAEPLLKQALLAVPMFGVRWRWNAGRVLAVLRQRGGRKVPPPLQRFQADDLLTAVFPAQTACQENQHGDIVIPDHPLIRQTMHDCLHEAMDLPRWLNLLKEIGEGAVELVPLDTREPSPFSHEILNANPYAFLDDAPLEERRARAVQTRRTLSPQELGDLAWLDPAVIDRVRTDAWPTVRDAEELHDTLLSLAALPQAEGEPWRGFFNELVRAGRAAVVRRSSGEDLWIAAEAWPLVRAALPDSVTEPQISLPAELDRTCTSIEGTLTLVRGRLEISGPVTAAEIAVDLGLDEPSVAASLEALEGEGVVLRGRFTPESGRKNPAASGQTTSMSTESGTIEWCDRRLLARIHRLTLDAARRAVEPVSPAGFMRFLVRRQHLTADARLEHRAAVLEVVQQLQGFELPAGVWEREVLPSRIKDYDPAWLDELSLAGEIAWGRLQPPRKTEEGAPTASGLTRAVSIALVARTELPWLLPTDRGQPEKYARSNAADVWAVLSTHGALFFEDLLATTGLLPSQLEDALSELAALGVVTADGFASIRRLVNPQRGGRTSTASRRGRSNGGRWSRFPGFVISKPEQRAERWASQLLDRYGVMFRDLLARETVAPTWRELAAVYRRWEAAGRIRGGRFVAGVGGEQFARPEAVEQLREARDSVGAGECVVVAATDPLNLTGIVLSGPRVPATANNLLALVDGRLAASRQAGDVQYHEELTPQLARQVERALRVNAVVRLREPQVVGGEKQLLHS